MLEKFEDLQIPEDATYEQAQAILEDKLQIKIADLVERLNQFLQDHAAEIGSNFLVMTPFGDYSKLLEEQPKIAQFLRTKAAQAKNWKALYVGTSRDPQLPQMVEIVFRNEAVDEGDNILGYVFLNFAGEVLHAFVHGEP